MWTERRDRSGRAKSITRILRSGWRTACIFFSPFLISTLGEWRRWSSVRGVKTLLQTAICFASISLSFAEDAPKPKPRPAPLVSPEVLPDGGVTFRFKAPKATEVKVSGQFGADTALAKGDDGVWSVTVPKVPAGVFEYHFSVDGMNVIDPQNSALKPQRWPGSNILHIPATPPAPWDWQDIPHGVIHVHSSASKALGKPRRILVYTPPGAGDVALPVLYLAHGYSDDERTWSVHGKAPWIMDSLIAGKKAVPMILVMPDAHAIPPGAAGFEDYGPANSDALCRELVQDIIPLVESSYQVDARPAARAFAGLSMGGHHALTIALNYHEKFNWIGAFSSAPPPAKSVSAGLDNAEGTNKDLRLLWIACGKKDFLLQRNNEFNALLKEKGVRFEFVETEGGHEWPVWRNYLTEFAPKIFR